MQENLAALPPLEFAEFIKNDLYSLSANGGVLNKVLAQYLRERDKNKILKTEPYRKAYPVQTWRGLTWTAYVGKKPHLDSILGVNSLQTAAVTHYEADGNTFSVMPVSHTGIRLFTDTFFDDYGNYIKPAGGESIRGRFFQSNDTDRGKSYGDGGVILILKEGYAIGQIAPHKHFCTFTIFIGVDSDISGHPENLKIALSEIKADANFSYPVFSKMVPVSDQHKG